MKSYSKGFSIALVLLGVLLLSSILSCGGSGGGDDPDNTVIVEIGDSYQGGKVAHIFEVGQPGYVSGEVHGLIASDNNLGDAEWSKEDFLDEQVVGLSTAIGAGSKNTALIIAQNGSGTDYAAGLAASYRGGGYSDWYLPSEGEAQYLINNYLELGGLYNYGYWSSNSTASNTGRAFNPMYNEWSNNNKSFNYRVRAMRTF